MRTARISTSVRLGLLSLALLLTSPLTLSRGQGPNGTGPLRLLFKYDPLADFAQSNIVDLRPNVGQNIYLFVRNTGEEPIQKLAVKLMRVDDNGTALPVAETIVPIVRKNAPAAIIFGAPKPPPAPEVKKDEKPGAEKKGLTGIELAGPPFELQVWFEWVEGKDNKVAKEVVPVRIREPREYVQVVDPTYSPKTRTVTFGVKTLAPIYDPPCQVNLVLSPDVIPGLIPLKTAGNYKQVLPQPKEPVQLQAVGLQFTTMPKFGRFYLTADGYDRAFMFANSFTKGELQPLAEQPRIRLFAPRYAIPGPKTAVQLEVDFPPNVKLLRKFDEQRPKPLLVRLSLDLDGNGTFVTLKDLKGHRQQQVTIDPAGPGGAVAFQTFSRDWAVEVDTADVYGRRQLRAELLQYTLDPETKTAAYRPVALVKEQDDESESILLFEEADRSSPYAPLSYFQSQAVQAAVTLDATPPAVEDFAANLEKRDTHVRGAPVFVSAKIEDQPPDTTIKQVVFFVGKLLPKDVIAPDAIKVEGVNYPPGSRNWVAQLPIQTDKPGSFDVGVQATNGAGLITSKTITLKLIDAPGAKNGKEGAAIVGAKVVGKVVVGGRPQPDVPVVLGDPNKGEVKGFTKTNAAGTFVFEKIMPGVYSLTAGKAALKLRGTTLVQVPPNVAVVDSVGGEPILIRLVR